MRAVGAARPTHAVSDMTLDQTATKLVVVGTAKQASTYNLADAGATWVSVSPNTTGNLPAYLSHEAEPITFTDKEAFHLTPLLFDQVKVCTSAGNDIANSGIDVACISASGTQILHRHETLGATPHYSNAVQIAAASNADSIALARRGTGETISWTEGIGAAAKIRGVRTSAAGTFDGTIFSVSENPDAETLQMLNNDQDDSPGMIPLFYTVTVPSLGVRVVPSPQ